MQDYMAKREKKRIEEMIEDLNLKNLLDKKTFELSLVKKIEFL